MVESRLDRTACAALSCMLIHSLAGTTKTGRCLPALLPSHACRNAGRTISSGPTRWTLTSSSWRHASTAPRTSGSGALSETHSVDHDVYRHQSSKFSGIVLSACKMTSWLPSPRGLRGPCTFRTCLHTRCGSLRSWQFGHSDRPVGVRKSWLRRRAVRRLEWRRLGLGIAVFLSNLQTQSLLSALPPDQPVTGLTCPPGPQAHSIADRRKSLRNCTWLNSNSGHSADTSPLQSGLQRVRAWQGEQHLLAHHILKQKPAFSIIPYLGLIFGNRSRSRRLRVRALWPEDQVELAF